MAASSKIDIEFVPHVKNSIGGEHKRFEALHQAVRLAEGSESFAVTVARAQAFYEFLNTQDA
jgi:hypothetical protein